MRTKALVRILGVILLVFCHTLVSCSKNDTDSDECDSTKLSDRCTTPDCPTPEMILSENWGCFVTRMMQNMSEKCETLLERFDFSFLPVSLYSNVRQSLYYVCRAMNSEKSKHYFTSQEFCTADEYENLVFKVCDPWHTPQPEIISRSCTAEVQACLTPIIKEERTLDWNFAKCILKFCDQNGIQFLGARRMLASTTLTDILTKVMMYTPLCVDTTNCYLENRPSLHKWYDPFEINFTLCLGAAPEWYQCSLRSKEELCSKPSVELPMGNICYQDNLYALGISNECDRQMFSCLHMQALATCNIINQYVDCLRKKCTRNEFQKIYLGVCATLKGMGYIFWAAAKVAPDYFNSILHYWKHGLMPAKMYDTRAVVRHECILVSSRVTRSNFLNISTDNYNDDSDLFVQRRKLVTLACKSVPRKPDIECSSHVLTCINKNVKTCEDIYEKKKCLREKCTKTETAHVMNESCRSLSFIEDLRSVIMSKEEKCISKFFRCLDSVYVHGDEWYRSLKVQKLLCSAIQSWQFRTCALNSSFCSEEDLMELIMASCLNTTKLQRLPSTRCVDRIEVCNFTFENSCQDLDNENVDCIRQSCDDNEIDKIYFRACNIHSIIKHSLYEMAYQNNTLCLIAIMECFNFSTHWLTMVWNHSFICSILQSEHFNECLIKRSCESSDLIIDPSCYINDEKLKRNKKCISRAKVCFEQKNCHEMDKSRLCLKDRCTEQESLQLREDLCRADEYLSAIIKAGGDDFWSIQTCALNNQPVTFEDKLLYETLQDGLCWAYANDVTAKCIQNNKLNVTSLERVMVMACTGDFHHMNGVADDCIRAVSYCVKTRRPRTCQEFTKGSYCFRDACKMYSLKYVVHEICKSLNFIRSVIEEMGRKSENCKLAVWECMEFPDIWIDIWMDVSMLQRRICILVNQEKYSLCVSENCDPDVFDILQTAACDVNKKATAIRNMALSTFGVWFDSLALLLIVVSI